MLRLAPTANRSTCLLEITKRVVQLGADTEGVVTYTQTSTSREDNIRTEVRYTLSVKPFENLLSCQQFSATAKLGLLHLVQHYNTGQSKAIDRKSVVQKWCTDA